MRTGKTTVKALFSAFVLVAGCGGAMKDVKTRAATDLSCPEGQIVVSEAGKDRYTAMGCGQKADCMETSGKMECHKEMPPAPMPAPNAPPPGAPPAQ